MKIYGYVRISTKDQNPERQLKALLERGIDKSKIFIDYESGKDFNRPSYKKLVNKVKKGDCVIIKSLDRLGRNYTEILEQWRIITKEIGSDIEIIDMPLLNTGSARDGLTGKLISDLVLQILAYVAETERDFIKQRQKEGIIVAKSRGVKFGRPRIELIEKFNEAKAYAHRRMLKDVDNRPDVSNAHKDTKHHIVGKISDGEGVESKELSIKDTKE